MQKPEIAPKSPQKPIKNVKKVEKTQNPRQVPGPGAACVVKKPPGR